MSEDEVKLFSPEELPEAISLAFSRIYGLESQLDALKAEYITPVADERTATWRTLKGGADMTRKDLELAYKIYKRFRQAEEMEDAAEGRRIQANIKRLFVACKRGETIDFLDALGEIEADIGAPQETDDDGFDDDVQAAEDHYATASLPQVEDRQAEATEHQPEEEQSNGPDADWGDDQTEVPSEQNDGSQDGFAYNAGVEAGKAGKTDIKALIREHDWHAKSSMAKSFRTGYAKGFRQWEAAQNAPLTDDEKYEINQAGHKAGYIGEPVSVDPYPIGGERSQLWRSGHEGGVIRRKGEVENGSAPVKLFDDGEESNVVEFGKPIPLPTIEVAASSGGAA